MEIITINFNKHIPLPVDPESVSFHKELYNNLSDLNAEYLPKVPNIDFKQFIEADLVIVIGTLHYYDEDNDLLDLNNLYGDTFMHITGCLGIPMLSITPPKEGKFLTYYDTHRLTFLNTLKSSLNKYKLNKNSKVIIVVVEKNYTISKEMFNIYKKVKNHLGKKYV